MLQALVMTDATSFQLLRSILEPDVRNQHAIELTEKFSFNEKFNFSQIFNREMDINFQPDFLKTSMNVMRDYQMKMKHHKCRELASIAVKVFDPRTVNLPDDNSVKLNLQKCALEIIQQTEEVMDELSFVEEHLNVLSETTPEIYVAYLPPHNFRKDPGNCPMQRSFWQHKHHAFSNRRRAKRNTIYEKNERNSVHCEGSYIFNQCDQLHYLLSSICDCISLKVFGSDTGQVLTYYFHPPIDDCNHRDQFHLMRLDSTSDYRLKAHRYVMCRALPRHADTVKRVVRSNGNLRTACRSHHMVDNSRQHSTANSGYVFGICAVKSVEEKRYIGGSKSLRGGPWNELCQTPAPSTASKHIIYPEITDAHNLMLRYQFFSNITDNMTYIDFILPQNILRDISSEYHAHTSCDAEPSNRSRMSTSQHFVFHERSMPSYNMPVFQTGQGSNEDGGHCFNDIGIFELPWSLINRPLTKLELEFHANRS